VKEYLKVHEIAKKGKGRLLVTRIFAQRKELENLDKSQRDDNNKLTWRL
jgi:hypothetical protein